MEADHENAPQAQEDSRSTSSSSSPVPPDNEESDFFLGANDSSSSLGVPNLQDMQVNDDECLPPVHRLPNEILIAIFIRLTSTSDILHVMLTCKRWARNAVDILWHRPACSSWSKHKTICQTLGSPNPYFAYSDFIKRLNLASLADKVNDGSVMPLALCTRVERLTLTNCRQLTDQGLIALVQSNRHLLALDISFDNQITEASIYAIAEYCRRLQGLNVSSCTKISNESMIKLAQNCRYIKRLKLNDCNQLTDDAIIAFAEHCPNILEIDLHQCRLIGNEPVTRLMSKGQSLRELRLVGCELIDDSAFLALPPNRVYEHLRILDLTSCSELTDRAVEKIVDVAPRLRNLVLAKCRRITDAAVYAISRLGKNLHYVHLGHCGQITDDAVKRLVQACNRIRYIDLGCCVHLTDDSVMKLATLPKLKRIGLVKCANITDESVYALARANQRPRTRRDADGNPIPGEHYSSSHSSLERVHLSYCTNLTLQSILRLLNSCPRLTHLSLTGVQAFLREDLEIYCRDAPPEFTEHQRSVFCVFSGQGVVGLRKYLNQERAFADLQVPPPPPGEPGVPNAGTNGVTVLDPAAAHAHADGAFDDVEPDVVDDEDVLEDGSEMIIDTQPLLPHEPVASTAPLGGNPVLPPPPPPPPHMFTGPVPPQPGLTVDPGPFNYTGDPPYHDQLGSPAALLQYLHQRNISLEEVQTLDPQALRNLIPNRPPAEAGSSAAPIAAPSAQTVAQPVDNQHSGDPAITAEAVEPAGLTGSHPQPNGGPGPA
ncbi:F-box domain-containing protein [Echria macrotheca]|uniref:F-box domain-containing protein n=1 Tax=Echria macrotheca TaxID=438768 RepID=A0AAJ0BCG3_9PEZI|nr:F-box domain-containing protein [Echria macrotheca]